MIELEHAQTGFGYMIAAYKMGGPFMHLITILGLLALGITVWKVIEIVGKKHFNTRFLDFVRMSGSLALAVGFLSQIVGIVQALEAIRAAADVSPQIVMGGAIVSFYAPIWGLIVFIFAMLFYYVLKAVIKAKKQGNN
jgi:hypothetical protein